MLHLTTKKFDSELSKISLPVVVMFYAAWCGKCAMTKPVIEDIEPRYRGRIRFCEVDIDESRKLANKYGADIVPTFVFFKDQKIVGTLSGPVSESSFEKYLHKIFRNC